MPRIPFHREKGTTGYPPLMNESFILCNGAVESFTVLGVNSLLAPDQFMMLQVEQHKPQ